MIIPRSVTFVQHNVSPFMQNCTLFVLRDPKFVFFYVIYVSTDPNLQYFVHAADQYQRTFCFPFNSDKKYFRAVLNRGFDAAVLQF